MAIEFGYKFEADGDVLNDYIHCDNYVSLIRGPLGCMRGDTEIVTSLGLARIDSITEPTQVLSWSADNSQFQLSQSGCAYPKGEDYLYQVSTLQGSFVAAAHHRVFCADGKYRHVRDLSAGDEVASCEPSLRLSVSGQFLRLTASVLYLSRIIAGLKGYYAALVRQCGQLLRGSINTALSISQQPDDALLYNPYFVREDDLVCVQSHSRQFEYADRICTPDFQRRNERLSGLPLLGVDNPPAIQFSLLLEVYIRGCQRSLGMFVRRQIDRVFSLCQSFFSLPQCYSSTERSIISIERLEEKEIYWDIHVARTNNYVTSDGTIHHNSGKTFASCDKVMRRMRDQRSHNGVRKSRWYAIRNTYSDLLTTTVKDWLEMFGELGRYTGGGMEPPTHRLEFQLEDVTTVVSELIFLALDRPADVKKLRGAQATGFWLNEVKEQVKSVFDMADLRHGRYPSIADGGPSWHGMIGDYNSPDEDHWLYELEADCPDGWTFHVQPGGLFKDGDNKDSNGRQIYKANPAAENLINLPKNYYERGQQGKGEDWINVNLCNEFGFVIDGKPVHPEYVDSVHCMTENYEPDPRLPIILGYDFGRTPAAALLQQTRIGRYICFDEFITDDFSASRFGPELKLYLDKTYGDAFEYKGYGDPAGDTQGEQIDDTCLKILRSAGLPAKPAAQNNNSAIRRASIANPLRRNCMDGRPALMITSKAKTIRKGLMGGFCHRRLQVTAERYTDKPDKNMYSHPVEALEYALVGSGEGRIAVRSAKRLDDMMGEAIPSNRYSRKKSVNDMYNPSYEGIV